ncbi:MAG: rhodanese-like domain-containing protein [Thermoanaerobaculia bacterium]
MSRKIVGTMTVIMALALVGCRSDGGTQTTATESTAGQATATTPAPSTAPPATQTVATSSAPAETSTAVIPATTSSVSKAPGSPALIKESNVPFPDVPRIMPDELKKLYDSGNVVIVDARSAIDYYNDHIKGARTIPLVQLPMKMNELPKDRMVVAYCT